MPFNGSGTFNRVYSWQSDKAAGIDITASRMDTDTNDISANGLSNCLTRDGQGSATANLPMNGFRHTGAGNAVNPGDYVPLGQLQAGVTFTGSPILTNGVALSVKTHAGATQALARIEADDNVNLFVAGGQNFRIQSQNGSAILLTVKNDGNISTTKSGSFNPIGTGDAGLAVNSGGNAAVFASAGPAFNLGIPGDGTLIGFFNGTSTVVGSIQSSGGVTAYNTTSDETLKDLVAPLTDSGSIIDGLKALWYRWKDRPLATPEPGFFAQAVHRVFPWAVSPGDSDRPWQMDASRLMPVVIAELQALRQRVAELEAR